MNQGGQDIIAPATYERIPVFVKAGSILPIGPSIQYTTEKKQDLIDLYVYDGADGQFSLYEDEGINYNYEKGKYSHIDITFDHKSKTLYLADRTGVFDGMLNERKFNVIFVDAAHSTGIDMKAKRSKMITYSGKALKIKL
ncbi:hypothetical protein D3C87_1563400 [compost metagenome]